MSISFYNHRTRFPSAGHDSKSFAVKNRKMKRNIGEILHRVSSARKMSVRNGRLSSNESQVWKKKDEIVSRAKGAKSTLDIFICTRWLEV